MALSITYKFSLQDFVVGLPANATIFVLLVKATVTAGKSPLKQNLRAKSFLKNLIVKSKFMY